MGNNISVITASKISTNYILNILRLIINAAALVFTMPYISRVLGSKSIGHVDYAYAIIEYFFLFSAIGIPMYGIRQIAKCRDDINERSRVVIELLTILSITTIFAYSVLYIMLYTFDYTADFKNMLLFLSIGIFFSNFNIEWFYQGIENQKYITVRYILIRLFSVVVLFLVVKKPDDVYYYALYLLISAFGGSIFNLLYLRKFILVNKDILSGIRLNRHIKPALTIFLASVATSIYIQLDKIMLGSMISEESVGYYTQAVKLPRYALSVVTAMGAVMLPRLSHLLNNNSKEEYMHYMQKSLKYIFIISIPVTIFFLLLAKDIILVMAGEEFIPSISVLKISSLNIFVVSLAYYIGFQVLYPLGKEKIYTISVIIAAVVNFIFNLLVIQNLREDGVALGTLIAEITGLVIMLLSSYMVLKEIKFFTRDNLKYFVAGVAMAILIFISSLFKFSSIINMLIAATGGFLLYFLVLYLLKETITTEIYLKISTHFISGNHSKR